MRILVLASLLASAAAPCFAQQVRLTHGPILGHVTAQEAWIWSRTSVPGEFRVRYGLAPDRLDKISSATATLPERDNAGPLPSACGKKLRCYPKPRT